MESAGLTTQGRHLILKQMTLGLLDLGVLNFYLEVWSKNIFFHSPLVLVHTSQDTNKPTMLILQL